MSRPSARTSWWSRHWRWFVPTGCLTVLVLVALLAGSAIFALFKGASHLLTSSEPWVYASARAASNPLAQARLGTPLEPRGVPMGSVSTNNGDSNAAFSIGVHGPKGNGKLYVDGQSEAGYWRYRRLEIVIGGSGERIDLREPSRIAPPAREDPPASSRGEPATEPEGQQDTRV